jgi:hypothetical protein
MPDPDQSGAGHTYFAAMESDNGATPSFFDGETSSINTTHGKFLTYPPSFGNIVPGAFIPVLAKHSKSFSLIDCISVGVDRMQRNFETMRKQRPSRTSQ